MERVGASVISALRGAGWEVGLVTTPFGDSSRRARASATVDALWMAGDKIGRYSVAWWWETSLRERPWWGWSPDVVISIGDGAGSLIARGSPVPTVIQAHGTFQSELMSSLRAGSLREFCKAPVHVLRVPLRATALRRATSVWAITERVARDLSRLPVRRSPSRTAVLPNGVPDVPAAVRRARDEVRAKLDLGPDDRAVLFAGRIHQQKGVHVAVDAVTALGSPYVLLVAGEGPQEAELRARVDGGVAEARVRFLGRLSRADLAATMVGADALVLPSLRTEGQPIVCLEAAGCGLPIVATANARLGEDLERSPHVRVVGASAAEIAQGIRELAADGGLRTPYLPEVSRESAAKLRYVCATDSLVSHRGEWGVTGD